MNDAEPKIVGYPPSNPLTIDIPMRHMVPSGFGTPARDVRGIVRVKVRGYGNGDVGAAAEFIRDGAPDAS
jgi:hypothetical protein